MSNFQKVLDKIRNYDTKNKVVQGGHQKEITKMFEEIISASLNEFTEDNWPTQEDFLDECYEDAKTIAIKKFYKDTTIIDKFRQDKKLKK